MFKILLISIIFYKWSKDPCGLIFMAEHMVTKCQNPVAFGVHDSRTSEVAS